MIWRSSFMSCLLDSCRSRCRFHDEMLLPWPVCLRWLQRHKPGSREKWRCDLAVWCLLMRGNCWSAQWYPAQKGSFFGWISKLQDRGGYGSEHTTFSSTSAPHCSPFKVSVLFLLFGGSSWNHLTMKLSGLLWVDVCDFCPQLTSLQILGYLQVTTKIHVISLWLSYWRVRPN